MLARIAVVVALASGAIQGPPDVLPAAATTKLGESLQAAAAHKRHLWRDTAAFDGNLVNAYIEIPFGERNKYEFSMAKNTRVVASPISAGGGVTASKTSIIAPPGAPRATVPRSVGETGTADAGRAIANEQARPRARVSARIIAIVLSLDRL